MKPPYLLGDGLKFIPLTIGKYSLIGSNSVVESAVIGSGCIIGNNCVLSKRCILKDHVIVEDGSVIPPDMVIPPFSRVSGNPARIVGEVGESSTTLSQQEAIARYKAFKPNISRRRDSSKQKR